MPSLGGKSALIAYEQDGAPLPEQEAAVKLLVAGDKALSRWVRGLTTVRVVEVRLRGGK